MSTENEKIVYIQNTIEQLLEGLDLKPEQIHDVMSHIRGITPSNKLTYIAPRTGWVCFHCGERFLTEDGARLHFGETPANKPLCINQSEN